MTIKHDIQFVLSQGNFFKSLFNNVVSSQCLNKKSLQILFPYRLSYLSMSQTTVNVYDPLAECLLS